MRFFILASSVAALAACGCDDGTAAAPVDYAPMLTALTEIVSALGVAIDFYCDGDNSG